MFENLTGPHAALRHAMSEIIDLDGIVGTLSWDEETQLPSGAHEARGRQTATLYAIRHQRLTDPRLGDLIDSVLAATTTPEVFRVATLRFKRRRDRETRIPERLVKAIASTKSTAVAAWRDARKNNAFQAFAPHLTEVVRLAKERADCLRDQGTRYDALLDEFEPEMTTARLTPVLEELETALVPIVAELTRREKPNNDFLTRHAFPSKGQWEFGMGVLRDVGFDLTRGRQDYSTHPFTETLSEHDIRVTTRVDESDVLSALFSTVHEAGHGMFEQGFDPAHFGTPLAYAPSLGLHESQSRLWENQVARSLPFWRHYLPKLTALFPQLSGVSVEAFHKAVNRVEPGFIRVEADEVTYNLHILVRFSIEKAMIDGDLPIAELPSVWNGKMQKYLGLTPPNDALGCLQDIHWPTFGIGYFPTYTIGNLYAAQLMATFVQAHPTYTQDFEKGQFGTLLSWLRTHVHRKGHLSSAEDTVRAATGAGLQVKPFVDYLKAKYGV